MKRWKNAVPVVLTFLVLSGSSLPAQMSSPHPSGGMMPMMGIHFPRLLMRAQKIAPDRADALRALSDKRMPAFIRQMAEVHIAALSLKNRLRDPSTSPEELDAAFRKLQQEKAKLMDLNREAVLDLRSVLGGEVFAKLLTMPMMMHQSGDKP